MAQFDVYRGRGGNFVLDCQSNTLRDINTRLAAPLGRPGDATIVSARLNPTLNVNGQPVVLLTHFATAIPARELHIKIASLEADRYTILAALDFLISGF